MPDTDPLEGLRRVLAQWGSMHLDQIEPGDMHRWLSQITEAKSEWEKERAAHDEAKSAAASHLEALGRVVVARNTLRAEALKVAEEIGCSGGLQSVRLEGWAARLRKACE